MLINEELLETFETEGEEKTLPTDVLSLLRDPNLDISDFVTAIITDYSSEIDERTIRNTVDRFPSRRPEREVPTAQMEAYISKFSMVLSSTPTLKSKYL